jgi:putative membrane protein
MAPLVAHVGSVTLEPFQIVPPLGVAIAYNRRARTLARRGRPVPAWKQACFTSGIVLILVALVSPIGDLADELLFMHMIEHLLIGDLAALLLVLGLTAPLLQPLLQVRAISRLRVLTHPAVALPLWAVDLYLWHLPALYQAALGNEALHGLQHACFIGAGICMWMPLFGPLPQPQWFGNAWKLGYILAVRFTGAVLGNVFLWAGSAFYPDYRAGDASWHISPITDQGLAGTVMMVEGSLVTLGLFAWLFFRAAREGEERQQLLDLAEERGIPLDEARAGRAVAAGRGAQLAERLTGAKHGPE